MHSKAKQTLEFRAEKGYYMAKQGEQVTLAEKKGTKKKRKPELPIGFQGSTFIGKNLGEGYKVCDFLLIG